MLQPPMISSPLKQTNEIDWVTPLKNYIRQTYGDDPERYAEECNTLNRLRQDMRGAGKDSTAGRDLLYRYYGQLELLDLRFPVDENHIKISFTWCVLIYFRNSTYHRRLTSRNFPGLTHSHISLLPNIHLPTKKLPLYSTSPRCCHATQHTRIDSRRRGKSKHFIRSRPLPACSPTSTKTFYMHHLRILAEKQSSA